MPDNKKVPFTKEGIESLPKNKPVVYNISDKNGEKLYTGVAKMGRVEQRLKEHLPGGPDPVRGGAKVVISQKSSIAEALKAESRIIKRDQPPQNIKGKK